MGAIIGALIGRHLAHTEEQHQAGRALVFPAIASYMRDPVNSPFSEDDVDNAVALGGKLNYFDKHTMAMLGPMLESAKKARQQGQLQRAQQGPGPGAVPQSVNLGTPTNDPTNAAAPAPAPQSVMAGGTPPQAPNVQAGPSPGGFNPMAAIGLAASPVPGLPAPPPPAPPFADGADTGTAPAPAQIPAPMASSSKAGTQGFSSVLPAAVTPTAATPPAATAAAPAPAPPMTPPPGMPTPPVADESVVPWHHSRTAADIAKVKGEAEAIQNLPLAKQANQLALEQQAAQYAQSQAQKIAEQQRMMTVLEKDPDYQKLNPLQKQEVKMRVMGVTGAMSNYVRPMNLPASSIPGSDFPPGSQTVDGKPIDPSKWYRQQQDPTGSGEIRGVETTPTLKKTGVLTEKGPVIAFTDPLGRVVQVVDKVNGSPITDPRLLETVKNSLAKFVTVDQDGNEVTNFYNAPSTSQKVLPGKKGVGTLPGPPSAGGGGESSPTTVVNTTGGTTVHAGASFPKALTAATRKSAEFARTLQEHIPVIENAINSLEKSGNLGLIASRWNDFKAGKIGTGPEYTALRDNLDLFDSGLGVVHQSKGKYMLEHFKSLADAGKMDPETLKSAFGVLKSWVNTYANMGKNRPGAVDTGTGGSEASSGGSTPAASGSDLLQKLLKKHGGG